MNPFLNPLPLYVVCGRQSSDGLLGIANQGLGPWALAASSLPPQAEGDLSCFEPPLEPIRGPIYAHLLSTSCHIFRQNGLLAACSICRLWQWGRLQFWVTGTIGGGRGACLGLSPQRAREKRGNPATELLEIILKTSLLLPQVSASQTTPGSAHLHHCLPGACTDHPCNRLPASSLPPQSATLCPATLAGRGCLPPL